MNKRREIVLNAKRQILDINRLGLEHKLYEDVINEAIEQAINYIDVRDSVKNLALSTVAPRFNAGNEIK